MLVGTLTSARLSLVRALYRYVTARYIQGRTWQSVKDCHWKGQESGALGNYLDRYRPHDCRSVHRLKQDIKIEEAAGIQH